jgi:hypothetical protein
LIAASLLTVVCAEPFLLAGEEAFSGKRLKRWETKECEYVGLTPPTSISGGFLKTLGEACEMARWQVPLS